MAHVSGKTGAVYGSATLLEDCEDAWATGGAGRVVDVTTGKVGTYAARVTTTDIGVTTLLQYEVISSTDLTTYDGIYFWIRSSVTTTAGQLQFLIDETNTCLSPEESLNIPACTTTVWRQCFALMTTPSALDAVLAIGLYQVANLADGTFDIDDVEALKDIAGIKSWTLDYTADALETTDFADGGIKSYIIGASGWSGSFEGFKDGAPLGIGSEVFLVFGETTTAYNSWIGKAYITAAHPVTAADGIVSYSYDFQGTGALQSPDA